MLNFFSYTLKTIDKNRKKIFVFQAFKFVKKYTKTFVIRMLKFLGKIMIRCPNKLTTHFTFENCSVN